VLKASVGWMLNYYMLKVYVDWMLKVYVFYVLSVKGVCRLGDEGIVDWILLKM